MRYYAYAVGALSLGGTLMGCICDSPFGDYSASEGAYGSPADAYGGTGGGWGTAGDPTGGAGGDQGVAGGSAAYCENDQACGQGFVCSPIDGCVFKVPNCPLTSECIGDPDGYSSEWESSWQGIDPLFVGSLDGDDVVALMDIDLDFYEDHVYGEGAIVFRSGTNEGWLEVLITGTRDGDTLQGQFLERWGVRRFDAVFEATLPSASEIVGSATFASELGTWTAAMHLYRTSPCGCTVEPSGVRDQRGLPRQQRLLGWRLRPLVQHRCGLW